MYKPFIFNPIQFEKKTTYQTLKVNNEKYTRARYINLHIIQKRNLCTTNLMGTFFCFLNGSKLLVV